MPLPLLVVLMTLLVFDTSFGACSAALFAEGRIVASRFERMERGHAERLVPMIGDVLTDAHLTPADLTSIAVTRGPGTFTGARITISAARALALATGVTLQGSTSLHLMALGARERLGDAGRSRALAIAVDARRGEVYFQMFSAAAEPTSDAMIVPPMMAAALLGGRPAFVAGSGAALVAAEAPGAIDAVLPDLEPDARSGALGFTAYSSEALRPLYLRPPDAKPQVGKSLSRAS